MDIEIEGPIDDLEALFADDDEMLGDAAVSNHPTLCSATG